MAPIVFRKNPIHSKRHNSQYISINSAFRPGSIDFGTGNIFNVIFIFHIIIVSTVIFLNVPATFSYNTGAISETKFGNYVFLANKNNQRVLIVNELESEADVLDKLNDLKVNKLNHSLLYII